MTRRNARTILFCSMAATLLCAVDLSAQRSSPRRGGLYGDWAIKLDINGEQMNSILSFTRDSEGNRTAQWISIWGMMDLKDVKYEDGQLSFAQERKNREGETVTSKFQGKIEEGKLSGTLSSSWGEAKVEGARSRRTRRAVGNWELKFKVGEREITNTLAVKAGDADALAVDWKSERVEHKITDVKYERGKLTFKTASKMEDRAWESAFEGTISGDTLAGVVKSERGEMAIEGKRVGAPLVGTWNLDIESERGDRKQRLRVNSDMSALYGSQPVEKVKFEDGKVNFKMVLEFGERTFEIEFEGKVEESKLTGELKTSRGTQKVTGTKVQRRFRRRPQQTI